MKRTSAFWEFDIVDVEPGKRAEETGVACRTPESEFPLMGQKFSFPVASNPSRWAPNGGPYESQLVTKSTLSRN